VPRNPAYCVRFSVKPQGVRGVVVSEATVAAILGSAARRGSRSRLGPFPSTPPDRSFGPTLSRNRRGVAWSIADQEAALTAASDTVDMRVMFMATDGVRELGAWHPETYELCIGQCGQSTATGHTMRLKGRAARLSGETEVKRWPKSHVMHLLKNKRQLIRKHSVALSRARRARGSGDGRWRIDEAQEGGGARALSAAGQARVMSEQAALGVTSLPHPEGGRGRDEHVARRAAAAAVGHRCRPPGRFLMDIAT
jgi:hypothetical protein